MHIPSSQFPAPSSLFPVPRSLFAVLIALALFAPLARALPEGEEGGGAHPAGKEAAADEHYESLRPRAFAVQLVGFTILAFILIRYAFPPIADALGRRRQRIKDELEGLERSERALEGEKAELEQRLRDVEKGSFGRLEAATLEGAGLRESLVKEGDQAAEQVRYKAKLEMEIEHQKMLLVLRNEIVDLSFRSAGELLREAVDRSAQDRIVDEFLDSMDVLSPETEVGA